MHEELKLGESALQLARIFQDINAGMAIFIASNNTPRLHSVQNSSTSTCPPT